MKKNMSLYLIPGLEKIQEHRTEQSTHCAMDPIYLQEDHLCRFLKNSDGRHVPLVVVELERL